MNTKTIQLIGAACTAALLFVPNLYAQLENWQTDLDFHLVQGQANEGNALAADASGNVFCGGFSGDATGTWHGLVLKRDTLGNWSLVDDTNLSPSQESSRVNGVGFDSNANLY